METFTKLFGSLLVFVYHCFDRIVIHGYLSGLSRPEQVVYFVRQVLGIPVVSKEVLSQRTNDDQGLGRGLCPQPQDPHRMGRERGSQRGLRVPALHRMEKSKAFGVYFIFKSLEQGSTSRISVPKYPTQDPHTASWHIRGAASPITISTFATRCWARSSSGWHRSSPFMRLTG